MRTEERSGARFARFRLVAVRLLVERFAGARFGLARLPALTVLRLVVDRFAVERVNFVVRVLRLAMLVSVLCRVVVSGYRDSQGTGTQIALFTTDGAHDYRTSGTPGRK